MVSRVLSVSPKTIHPDNTENTDSILIISAATTGDSLLCVMICKVNATPDDNMPAYKIGNHDMVIAEISGSSKININAVDIRAVTPN